MTFNPTQKKLFDKNLNALSNLILKEELKKIKDTKFELVLGKDNLDINLKDTSDNTFLYENVISELNTMLNTYNDKYLLYPVLYFYGFGNGILFKALLQNKNHQHIVVFEKDLEIIWTMFHILDFTLEIKDGRLILFDLNKTTMEDLNFLINCEPFFSFIRVYFLELSSNYYEKFHEDVLEFNTSFNEIIKKFVLSKGNDPQDALQGIEQFIYNLPQMIKNPSYKELINKRLKLSDTAIIVSTGPSLTKQLPLLKKYANKATIIAADSSYPILYKHNIKPDYVLSLERIPLTSEFFNNDFGEFDKDIVFIINYLTHIKTIQNLQCNKRNFMLVLRDSNFIESLNLKRFGYLVGGQSVAHIAYGVAAFLMHKNIILIGQDLAYAEDGFSHTKDYSNLDKHKGHFERDFGLFRTQAYGGKGHVESSLIWSLFRMRILIAQNEHIKTYNCTEGGARIKHSLEKPFSWVCENLLKKELNKPFTMLNSLNIEKQKEFTLQAYSKIIRSILHCKKFKNESLQQINLIETTLTNIKGVNLTSDKKVFNEIIAKIDFFKKNFENHNEMQDIADILRAILFHFELNLARIYVLNPKTPEDGFHKSLLWIKEHIEFIKIVYGHVDIQEKAMIEKLKPLEQELENLKLNKWRDKIKNANKSNL
ncbi:motility associated factor glycosyltransferase family protein [Campylobacter jejuni]|uniref:motility associated factor glycosyltransferase family protein n=1 Tax=Campylobacter jejuni TaxID=197 RepID=UPI0009452974|nr:motility associated factor glycosyltransferase family protein [Campylobacter jejuni]EKL9036274.1 motility associated factor glycosyltransferase family protein [Campylobacter jejuni]ELI2348029.1 motility associated factor glycosyltransferase family protein [Campylobacter jejuni]OKY14566.1 PseD protein [Campylobacter jejuni]HEB8433702.1 motility associated factor glycosyltransferase family protein [Campylobacter jejuni]